MDDERKICGHTEEEHAGFQDLPGLIEHVQHTIVNPRVVLVVGDTGDVHFVTSLPPGEAAQMIERLASRIRRYGANYVRDHFERGEAAQWN